MQHNHFWLTLVLRFVLAAGFFSPLFSTALAQEMPAPADIPLAAPVNPAAQPAAPAELPAPERESYLVWYFKALGPLFAPVFGILSIVFVMLIVMNWLAVSRNHVMPPEMLDQFKELLDAKDFQQAYEIAKDSDSPQGRILAAGMAKMSAGYAAAEQAMTNVAEEEIMRLEQKLGYLATIAGISPMIGLLGTVFGMVASFSVIAYSAGTPQASELAKGISTALVTTQVGLLIAIPAIIIYEIFRNKLALLVLEMTVQTETLMGRFKK